MELQDFIDGYINAAMWTTSVDEKGEEMMDQHFDKSDIHPDSMEKIKEVCEKFFTENVELMETIGATYSSQSHGHDFWLTRNGHGVGFWDRGYGEAGDILTEKCKPYGESYWYLGDDGKIHVD